MEYSILNSGIGKMSSLSGNEDDFSILENPLFHSLKILSNKGGFTRYDGKMRVEALETFSKLIKLYENIDDKHYMSLSPLKIQEIKKNLSKIEYKNNVIWPSIDRFMNITTSLVNINNLSEEVDEKKKLFKIQVKRITKNIDEAINSGENLKARDLDYSINLKNVSVIISLKNLIFEDEYIDNINHGFDEVKEVREWLRNFEIIDTEDYESVEMIVDILPVLIKEDIKIQKLINEYYEREDKKEKLKQVEDIKSIVEKCLTFLSITSKKSLFWLDKDVRKEYLQSELVQKTQESLTKKNKI